MIKLIRNLDSNRDKEQEDSFIQTMNHTLFFDSHKTITKIDSWKISNIKKMIDVIKSEEIKNLHIEFTLWNKNLVLLKNELNLEIIEPKAMKDINKKVFVDKDIVGIHKLINVSKDDKNMKMAILITMYELIGDEDSMTLINNSINKNIPSLDIAIDSLLPKFLTGDNNE